MSDAQVQSVERKPKAAKRCKYHHDWSKIGTEPETYTCDRCGYTPQKQTEAYQEAESILYLRDLIKPGDTVHTVLRHVSRSGMSRGIDVYFLKDSEPIWITAYVGHAIGSPQPMEYWRKSLGLKIGGCGMDMGFHVVESLSRVLYPTYQCRGNSQFTDGHCPSNYHVNHRDTVHCMGIGTGDNWQPCHRSDSIMLPTIQVEGIEIPQGRANTVEIDGKETICPTCQGHGRHANPDGPERWDLLHTDGYALRHKWL